MDAKYERSIPGGQDVLVKAGISFDANLPHVEQFYSYFMRALASLLGDAAKTFDDPYSAGIFFLIPSSNERADPFPSNQRIRIADAGVDDYRETTGQIRSQLHRRCSQPRQSRLVKRHAGIRG